MEKVYEFLDFAQASPTAFHAAYNACGILKENGFTQLREHEPWLLEEGGKYYVSRNGSAVIAFRVPEDGLRPFRIVASHSDSPTFKLKHITEEKAVGDRYLRLNVERYGGMIMSTWMDRPLGIAGRLVIREEDQLVSRLVDLDRDAVLIPNQPIHFNREVNSGYKFDAQRDMMPLYGTGANEKDLKRELAARAGCEEENILAGDLFLYSRVPGSLWGADEQFFSCGRIDDLECAWTSLQAFLKAEGSEGFCVWAMLDNEEVGSGSKQGADSTFLEDVLFRAGQALGSGDGEIRARIAAGFMVSADNAHAVHPNHPEMYDADNRVWMNGGVVIKFNASQKYTTDAVSAAVFAEICSRTDVPVQYFANRSDLAGGSTLGNISNAHVSMNTVDIGLAQLAMHSSYETAGTQDLVYMTDALKAFWLADLSMTDDGQFRLL